MKHSFLRRMLLSLFLIAIAPAISMAKVFKTESRIVVVSPHSITVAIGHAKHSYKITKETAIHVDGVKAGAKALKKGMHAEVTDSLLSPRTAASIEAQHPS